MINTLVKLHNLDIKILLDNDKLRLDGPKGAIDNGLISEISEQKELLIAAFKGQAFEEVFEPGNTLKVYRAREECLRVGGCQDIECNLFPLTWCWGWCRERVRGP